MVGEDQSCPAQIKADGSTAQQPASEYAAAAVNTHGGLSSEESKYTKYIIYYYLLAKAVNESFHNIHNLTFLDIYLLKSKCYMPKVMIGRNFLSFIELCTCTDRSHTSHTWDPKKVISEELNLIPWTPVETFCWQIGCRNICSILSGDNSPQLWGVVLC